MRQHFEIPNLPMGDDEASLFFALSDTSYCQIEAPTIRPKSHVLLDTLGEVTELRFEAIASFRMTEFHGI